jgi:hypothetical protein
MSKIVWGKKTLRRGQGSELKVISFGGECFQTFKLKDLRQ